MSGRKQHLGADVPYVEAIREIEKIQTCVNPRDMLACLSSAFAGMKSAVVDHHKGKTELQQMDDVLPLSIYVVSRSELSHPASLHNMMEDYLKANESRSGFDLERKLLTNFHCAV